MFILCYFIIRFDIHLRLVGNGSQLPTVGGLELQICLESTSMKRSTKRPISTNPPIVGRCCYQQAFFLSKRQTFFVFCIYSHVSNCAALSGCEFAKFNFLKSGKIFYFTLAVGKAYSFTSLGLSDGLCGL